MKKILISLMLLLCPLCVDASFHDEKEESDLKINVVESVKRPDVGDVFPERETYYTKVEFLKGFQPLIHGSLLNDFVIGWSAIYDAHAEALKAHKPARRLSVKNEAEHIHCFYNSLIDADPMDEDYLEMQKITIYSRFVNKAHLDLIAAKDSNLAERITSFMGL